MHKFNWKPDLPSIKDFFYNRSILKGVNPNALELPPLVDLRPQCPPVVNQGDIGSCTGNALAGALEFLELQQIKTAAYPEPQEFTKGTFEHVSRLFIYYNERVIEGTVDQDSGAMLRDGIQALSGVGACRESLWVYQNGNEFMKPSDAAFLEAKDHRISIAFRLQDLHEMKHCLADGYPFVFGFTVYDSFMSNETSSTGVVKMPNHWENCQGGHAVCAVGYNDHAQTLIVRNSWGPEWGDKGYFYLPYGYITDRNLSDDFWTIRK